MQIHLLSAFPVPPVNPYNFASLWLRESAEMDPFGVHQVTEDPAAADIILFVESHPSDDPYLLSVRRHPLYRRYSNKCFLYQDADFAVPIIRGIYPSILRRDYQPDRCRSAGYIARIQSNDAIQYDPARPSGKWLYSFIGEDNSPVRSALFRRSHPNGFVKDTTGKRLWEMKPGPEQEAFVRQYAEAIHESRFVLCPGGLGPLTYRLFETMEMGRVPVVLSDDWVPTNGPSWGDFSIQLPENRVDEIDVILADHDARHKEMGQLARQAWEQWFAKPVCFHRLVELCTELKAVKPHTFSSLRAWRTLTRPPHLFNWLRPHYRLWKSRAISIIKRAPTTET